MLSLKRSKSPWQKYGPFHLGWNKQEEEEKKPYTTWKDERECLDGPRLVHQSCNY
jgi:hypothetical protein